MSVLPVVELLEPRVALADRNPPVGVLDVPVDRVVQRLIRIPARAPADLVPDAAGIETVAPVVPRSVLNVTNEGGWLTDALEDGVDDLEVLSFIVGTDVVCHAAGAGAKHGVDGGHV